MARVADETIDLDVPVPPPPPPPPARRARRERVARERAARIPAWEWTITVLALFALARGPIAFYRREIAKLTSGDTFYVWQDDGVIRAVTATILISLYVIAARRCNARTLLYQPLLLLFTGLVLASITWSAEPTVSLWRAGFFMGTAVFGWYIGERYAIWQQISLVGAAAAVAAAASAVALVAWPVATQRAGGVHAWTGAYANRGRLGLIMSLGLMAIPFLWNVVQRRSRVLLLVIGIAEAVLLVGTGSRTGPVAVAVAATTGAAVVVARRLDVKPLGSWAGAAVVGLLSGYVTLVVLWNRGTIERWLGRRPHLSGRTRIWIMDLILAFKRRWFGWGFEAFWAHPVTLELVHKAYGRPVLTAHSGYYEILLSVGLVGLFIFLAFLGVAVWRAFRFAFHGRDIISMWPLVFLVFAAAANVAESLFVSAESIWALTVAAAISTRRAARAGSY